MSRIFKIFKRIFVKYNLFNFLQKTDDDVYRSKSIFRNDTVGFKFLSFIFYIKLKINRFY